MRSRHLAFGLLTQLGTAGCGQGAVATDGPDAGPAVSWHQQVAPIVAERCGGCHRDGGVAPFSLSSYGDAAPRAVALLESVEAGDMPPWSAASTDDCAPRHGWRDDPRLDADELAVLRAWVEDGAPEGDAASATPPLVPPDPHLADPTHVVAPEVPFVASGASDQIVCFLIDPNLAQPTWLTGIEFRPGNLAVVHHASLTAAPPDTHEALRARVQPDGSFDCVGAGANFLGVWVPGSGPYELPAGAGIALPADPLLVLQVHYHPHGTVAAPDTTSVALRLTDAAPPRLVQFLSFGNAVAAPGLLPGPGDRGVVEFRIPAGVSDHGESMLDAVPLEPGVRLPIVSLFPHQHYVGVELEAKITRATPPAGEPADECLIEVPRWNFDWQRTYLYDAPIEELPTVGAGDVVALRCRYDNTLGNPFVVRGLGESGLPAPVDVFLGEQTMDDMCLLTIGVLR